MFCPKCGSQSEAERFCRMCGTNLVLVSDAVTGVLVFGGLKVRRREEGNRNFSVNDY